MGFKHLYFWSAKAYQEPTDLTDGLVILFNEILGRGVELPDRPRRIVSFSPAVTVTLFIIGFFENLSGFSAFCARPPAAAARRRVGSYNSVRTDLLRELKPDLVFTVTGYQRQFAADLSKSWPVYPLELPVSVAGIVDLVEKVGLVVGQEKARELAGELLRAVPALRGGRRLRAYVEINLGGPVSFGAHSYITDALRIIGSSSVYEKERCEWLAPDLAQVADIDPDLIIYEAKMFSKFTESDLKELVRSRGWAGIRAVKEGRFYLTPGPLDFLAHHGPSFITQVLPWLEKTLTAAEGSQ